MKTFFVGKRDYTSTLRLQELIFDQKIKRQTCSMRGETQLPLLPDVTLLVEHADPVYTIGRRDTSEGLPCGLLIDTIKTRRGGGITFHGPGQLTAYPIANIQRLWKNNGQPSKPRSPIEWFSGVLEQSMMDTCAHYGVPTHPCKTGVWSDTWDKQKPRKVGSIGLQLGSWVSMHGASLNVSTDLSHFSRIVMCELPGESATSLETELVLRGASISVPTVADVAQLFFQSFVSNLAQQTDNFCISEPVDLSGDEEWESTLLASAGFHDTVI